jgi:hypothetical protein
LVEAVTDFAENEEKKMEAPHLLMERSIDLQPSLI